MEPRPDSAQAQRALRCKGRVPAGRHCPEPQAPGQTRRHATTQTNRCLIPCLKPNPNWTTNAQPPRHQTEAATKCLLLPIADTGKAPKFGVLKHPRLTPDATLSHELRGRKFWWQGSVIRWRHSRNSKHRMMRFEVYVIKPRQPQR